MAKKGPGLTPKQRRFALEYLVDLNATQAAIRTGYAKGSAEVTGCRLLSNDKIRAFIAKRQTKNEQKLGLTAERIDQEISRLAFRDPKDFVDPTTKQWHNLEDIPEDLRRCISSVTTDDKGRTTYKLERKGEALQLACRRQGLLKDHLEVDVTTHADLMLVVEQRAKELAKK